MKACFFISFKSLWGCGTCFCFCLNGLCCFLRLSTCLFARGLSGSDFSCFFLLDRLDLCLSSLNNFQKLWIFIKFRFKNHNVEISKFNSSLFEYGIFIFSLHDYHSNVLFLRVNCWRSVNHLVNACYLLSHLDFNDFKKSFFWEDFKFCCFFFGKLWYVLDLSH